MLGWMKYTAEKSSKSKDQLEQLPRQAKRGLEIYEGLPPSKKGAFIERWKETKSSKNLDWLKDFEECLTKKKASEREKECGLFTRQLCNHSCIYIYIYMCIHFLSVDC